MRLPRITTIALMVVVAITAVGLGIQRERHLRFKKIAAHHFPKSSGLGVGGVGMAWITDREGRPIPIEDSGRFGREMWWHREMYNKYAWAARHPWWPLSPDPPPEW